MNKENIYQLIKDVKDGVIGMNDVNKILDEKTTPIKMDIPLNQFDDGDDDDDFIYEDDLIDDMDVVIPPKCYLNNIIPNLDSGYVRKEWLKFVLNNMDSETYSNSVDNFIRSMKTQIQKELWKKELSKLTPKQKGELKNDKVTLDFKDEYIQKESDKLTNQMVDEFQKWYEDMTFKKMDKGKLNEK